MSPIASILPPDWFEVLSLQNHNTRLVVATTTLLGSAAGAIGGFLLLRKRSLMGDALSHATLPGIATAFALMVAFGGSGRHLGGLLAGAALAGLIGVAIMLLIRHTTKLGDDAAMGFVLSVFFGLGVAILRMVQDLPGASAAGLQAFIYGKPASMIGSDLVAIAVSAAVILLISHFVFKELALLCFDETYAAAQGWPVRGLDVLLLSLVTAVTVIGLQAVGLILIIALLITPACAARFWTNHLATMIRLAAAIGAASGFFGAMLSALVPRLPAGAVIVLTAAGFFLLSLIFAPARGTLVRLVRKHRLQRTVERQHLLRAMYERLESGNSDTPGQVTNRPIAFGELLAKRSWSAAELRRTIQRCCARGDLEPPDSSGRVGLSESGFGEAARITRNHRLWEVYLVTHADVAPNHVDRDADMVEHILDAALVRRLETVLHEHNTWVPLPQSPHPPRDPAGHSPA